MHMIEKRMYRENKDQPKARNLMYKGDGTVFSILKPKDGGVEGLGDIELLTYCDLASQTMNNSPEITVGLTYDKRLCETLLERLNHVTIGPSFQSGSDKPADASQAFIWSYRQSEKRTRKGLGIGVCHGDRLKKILSVQVRGRIFLQKMPFEALFCP